jgi:hypothetical protein
MQEMVGFGPEIGFLLDEKALHEVSPTLLRVGNQFKVVTLVRDKIQPRVAGGRR